MAIKKLSTKHLLTLATACLAGYCASPVLTGWAAGSLLDVFKDDFKKIFGNFLGHGSHELAVKYFEYKEKTANNEKNHDLRKWLVIAVVELLEREVERLKVERKYLGSELLIERMSTIEARLDAVMPDERYQAVTEAALTDFLVPQHVDFATARALKPELWLEILGGVVADVEGTQDPSAKAQKREALESAAKALHEKLPLELVVKYREAFKENPEIYVAVQTSLSQLMMEELRATGTDVKRLAAQSAEYQEKFAQFTQANLAAMQRLATKQDDMGRDFRAFVNRYEKDYGIQINLLEEICRGNHEILAAVLAGKAENLEQHGKTQDQLEKALEKIDGLPDAVAARIAQITPPPASHSPLTPNLTPKELSIKTNAYLERLSKDTAHIELRNIKNVPLLPLPVEQAYVPLRGVPLRGRGQAGQEDEGREVDVQLKEVLAKFGPRVAIIGGAGSGKSTVLQHMAWVLASAASKRVNGQPDITTPHDVLGLAVTPDNMPVPIFAPLPKLQAATNSAALKNEINRYLTAEKHYDLPGGYVESLLKASRVVVLLLDGLDEVASDPMRVTLRKAIDELASEYQANLYIAVTCRTAAYTGQTPLKEGFNIVNVKPLEPADVENLIVKAGKAMTALGFGGEAIATALKTGIAELERQRKEQLGDRYAPLVDSPLMVRLMLIVQSGDPGKPLPVARAELFERVVEAALMHDYGPDGQSAEALDGRWEIRRSWMQRLAYDMQTSEQGKRAGSVEYSPSELDAALHGDEPALHEKDGLTAFVRGRATLLEERDNQYRFIHRAIQEFLAARYLCEVTGGRGKAPVKTIKERVAAVLEVVKPVVDKSWWRECILLVAGYWAWRDEALAREFVRALTQVGDKPETCFAAADLAGNAALEWAGSDAATRELCANRVASLLAKEDNLLNSEPRTRHRAALAMSHLGDPRFHGPEGFYLPNDPMLGFMKIEADKHFVIGTRSKDEAKVMRITESRERLAEHEINDDAVETPMFYLARYPVTMAQFRLYVEPKWSAKDLCAPSQPVVGVNWAEARDYCAWLNQCWASGEFEKSFKNNKLIDFLRAQWRFALPNELLWEKAARGGSSDIYTWGDDAERLPKMANAADHIGATTVAGCYAANAYGLHDMIGNVWEWTSSRYQAYPPHPGYEEKEQPGIKDAMVMRGGSWNYYRASARCAFRDLYHPDFRFYFIGFRLMLRPPC